MEDIFWYLFASSRGGPTRVRIIDTLLERPRNANELARILDYDYTTIRHHLDVLEENNIVRSTGSGYGDVYLLTDAAKTEQETLASVLDVVREEP